MIQILATSAGSSVSAQAIDDTTYYKELNKIESSYWTSGRLDIKISYQYLEVDSTGSITDSMIISCWAHRDSFYMVADSVEQMQNGSYRVVVYNQDSIMQISNPTPFYYNLVNQNLLSSEFRDLYILGYTKIDSASCRKLSVQFKNTSPYIRYDITYDTATNFIQSIDCVVKKGDYLTPPSESMLMSQPEGFISIKQSFITGVVSSFDAPFFDSGRFFTIQNGVYKPVTPYVNFELFNSITQQ
jgi:hypothetical protein